MTAARHVPVLKNEVIASLCVAAGRSYVDGTFGAGGFTQAILESASDVRVVAIDRDPDAVREGVPLGRRYGDRLILIHGRFGDMDRLVRAHGIGQVHGVTLDLGMSSMQLAPDRGFSFMRDSRLDMRMERQGPSAADIVNHESESRLADIMYRYGEERRSRRVARAIVRARSAQPITTTVRLAEIVRGAVPAAGRIDPATRAFQAFRIYVNDELGELDRGLGAAERLLAPGGRLSVVAFHSLEDRIVKRFLAGRTAGGGAGHSRHVPGPAEPRPVPTFVRVSRRPVRPGAAERALNPRSRSARLRIAERTAAPARPAPEELS